MKKLILSVTTIAGFSLSGLAQGYITFDGSNNSNPSPSANSSGLVFFYGALDTTTDINAELVYGTSSSFNPFNGTPVVTLLLSSNNGGTGSTALGQTLSANGDITSYANGTLYDFTGSIYQIPNVAAGSTAYFSVFAWLGNYSSFNQANDANAWTGWTRVFSEVLSSGSSQTSADIGNMPGLLLIDQAAFGPEPASFPLTASGLALASTFLFRRRKA